MHTISVSINERKYIKNYLISYKIEEELIFLLAKEMILQNNIHLSSFRKSKLLKEILKKILKNININIIDIIMINNILDYVFKEIKKDNSIINYNIIQNINNNFMNYNNYLIDEDFINYGLYKKIILILLVKNAWNYIARNLQKILNHTYNYVQKWKNLILIIW